MISEKFFTGDSNVEIEVGFAKLLVASPIDMAMVLQEKSGPRSITISISGLTYFYMKKLMSGDEPSSPNIFGFAGELTQALAASLQKIVIWDINDDTTFEAYATVADDRADRTYNLPILITDGVVLALSLNRPIFILEEIFKKAHDMLTRDQAIRTFANMDTDKVTKH